MNQNLDDGLKIAKFFANNCSKIPTVSKMALFGSVAHTLLNPSERKRKYKDLDIVIWLDSLDELPKLRKMRAFSCVEYNKRNNYGFADHELDVFLLDAQSNQFLGFLCVFNSCPKYSEEQLNKKCILNFNFSTATFETCGTPPFLKEFADFKFDPLAVSDENIIVLYETGN